MKDFFKEEITKTINDIKASKEKNDLCFCMMTDSHLSDEMSDTIDNICAVDKEINFDFIVHLGNITNGDNPKNITLRLLKSETEKLKNSIKSKKLFITQGGTDGWRDERFEGQLSMNMITDEAWNEVLSYTKDYENISRKDNKPYYYVDFDNTRLIFLCSYTSEIDEENELFTKQLHIDIKQLGWLKTEALYNCEGKNVILFSHKIQNSRFETGKDIFAYKGNSTELLFSILQRAKKRGVNIACWFGGGYNCDGNMTVADINLSIIDSQLPKINPTAKCDDVIIPESRDLNTKNQDCWTAVLIKPDKRELKLFRFGSGNDFTIRY